MIEIIAPEGPFQDAGEGVEGLLEAWLVEEGERVSAGQAVAEAIVVKTSFQVCTAYDGTIARIVVAKGYSFGPGAVLAELEEDGGARPAAGVAAVEPAVAGAVPPADLVAVEPAVAGAVPPADVVAAEPAPREAAASRVPFTRIRGAVAREMALAWQHPRVAVGVEVDMTAALSAIDRLRAEVPGLSPTHAVLRAVALTLREHPRLNARVLDDGVEVVPEVNIGLAVSLDEGVIVPVIRDADSKSMPELAGEARKLARAARAGSLSGSALRDGTLTISNLGATGIDWFTPILNAPQVAIVGVGRVADRVVARDGVAAVAPTLVLTLVFDHRAVDGQPAALFLAAIRDRLERAEL